jgi:hypothetical protein
MEARLMKGYSAGRGGGGIEEEEGTDIQKRQMRGCRHYAAGSRMFF